MSRWDDLEQGQDDLVKDDRARKKLKRAVQNVKPGISDQESLYTDHNAGDPRRQAHSNRIDSQASYGGEPDTASSGPSRIGESWKALRQGLSDAIGEIRNSRGGHPKTGR